MTTTHKTRTLNIFGYIITVTKDRRDIAGTIEDRQEQERELEIKVDFDKAADTSDKLDELLDFSKLRSARKQFNATRPDAVTA